MIDLNGKPNSKHSEKSFYVFSKFSPLYHSLLTFVQAFYLYVMFISDTYQMFENIMYANLRKLFFLQGVWSADF